MSEGSAARTRSGVGPSSNSASNTLLVASSANPVRIPETRFSPIVATVSRRFASQPSRMAWPMSPGNCRAIAKKLVSASR
jgi:hypothetical protein